MNQNNFLVIYLYITYLYKYCNKTNTLEFDRETNVERLAWIVVEEWRIADHFANGAERIKEKQIEIL